MGKFSKVYEEWVEGANVNRSVVAEYRVIKVYDVDETKNLLGCGRSSALFPVSFFYGLSPQSSPFAIHRP